MKAVVECRKGQESRGGTEEGTMLTFRYCKAHRGFFEKHYGAGRVDRSRTRWNLLLLLMDMCFFPIFGFFSRLFG